MGLGQGSLQTWDALAFVYLVRLQVHREEFGGGSTAAQQEDELDKNLGKTRMLEPPSPHHLSLKVLQRVRAIASPLSLPLANTISICTGRAFIDMGFPSQPRLALEQYGTVYI